MAAVKILRDGAVAILEIDNPPVNASAQPVRQGLLDALVACENDPSVAAIVIAGAGRTFTAGGDITEFDHPPREPHLPDVLDRIEASTKPVVTAWHGTAFGGGCEIGVASHARVIAKEGVIALPEVKLGLIPGAGGTQRLPRLCGPIAALDIITTGRTVSAGEALRLGIVDGVADGDVRQAASDLARSLIGEAPRRTSDRAVAAPAPEAWEEAITRVKKAARGRAAPLAALRLVRAAIDLPFATGRAEERRTFLDLVASDESRALRYVFLAERAAGKLPELAGISAAPIGEVAVIGAGTMGSGIAVAFAEAGYRVTVFETSEVALTAGETRIASLHERSLKSGRLSADEAAAQAARLSYTVDLSSVSRADLVIEAVFEEMAVKKTLFEALAPHVKPAALLASNTSYLDIDIMAAMVSGPERFLGLHFFSPAHVMKLLEIVRGRLTSPATLATALAVARRLGKTAVIAGVCEGFIGNRILAKYRAQCEFMLEEGALPAEIDAALEAFGFAMGPFAVQDLAGLDISWARRKRLAATRNPADRDVPLADRLCEMGRFGQKSGRGWYLYDSGKRQADPEIEAMVRAHAATTGRAQRNFTAPDIQMRVLAAIVNEGAKILEEAIAARPSDIDVVLVNGYGFPRWRGGPMFHADRIGLSDIAALAQAAAERDGPAFALSPHLARLTETGSAFAALPSHPVQS